MRCDWCSAPSRAPTTQVCAVLRLLAALVFFVSFLSSAAAIKPNVVMIVSDDQGWTDFGFMGHPAIQTPHLDKLASESAVFPNGYVPTSLCRASLATLLTGLYASQHKICCNDPPDGVAREAMHPFIQNAPTVPRLLRQLGYRSLQTGKFWEGHFSNGGFTDGMTEKGRHGDSGLAIGRQTMKPIYDFIEAGGAQPFFVWYAPMMPHDPHTPPERMLKKYLVGGRNEKLARYWAMCEWFDETCGELLGWLDRKGLRENTLVVFVVDNGWIQETGPRQTTRGWFAPKSKLSPYDGGLRTPLMFRWPGHIKPGKYSDLVSTIDLAPTILTACGLKPAQSMPGLNLLGVAAGQGQLQRDAIFGEIFLHTAVNIGQPALNLTHLWMRQGDWKLIKFTDKNVKPELYDLARDPFETNNLAATEAERVQHLSARLAKWNEQSSGASRSATGEASTASPGRSRGQITATATRPATFPHRIWAACDFEARTSDYGWFGPADTNNIPRYPGNRTALGVSAKPYQNFSALMTGINPVPGPRMGKSNHLYLRYFLKGGTEATFQHFSLTREDNQHINVSALAEGKWSEVTMNFSRDARRNDGSAETFGEGERMDDFKVFAGKPAEASKYELFIDDVIFFADNPELPPEKEPFPNRVIYLAAFDTGPKEKYWLGEFELAESGLPADSYWKVARAIPRKEGGGKWMRLQIEPPRPVGAHTKLRFRYHLTGASSMTVQIFDATAQDNRHINLGGLQQGAWTTLYLNFTKDSKRNDGSAGPFAAGNLVDDLFFFLPPDAGQQVNLLIDEVVLYDAGQAK
jgi:arylsulfatase A-like enzyme